MNEVSLYVPEPVVSITGPLVPGNLHLLGKPGSGFRPRWLPFYAPAAPPAWNDAGAYPGEWTECIASLIENRQAREWSLTGKARSRWEIARQRWHDQQYQPEPDDVIEALRKADTQALRIALVIAESMNPGAGGEISAEAVSCAVAIMDYCINVWRALPGNSTMTVSRREDVMDTAHRRLVAWLETRPPRTEGLPEGSKPRPGRIAPRSPAVAARVAQEAERANPGAPGPVARLRRPGQIRPWRPSDSLALRPSARICTGLRSDVAATSLRSRLYIHPPRNETPVRENRDTHPERCCARCCIGPATSLRNIARGPPDGRVPVLRHRRPRRPFRPASAPTASTAKPNTSPHKTKSGKERTP